MATRLGLVWVAVFVLAWSVLAPSESAAGAPATSAGTGSSPVTIRVLSTRADLISGGDALVGVFLPTGVDPSRVRVTLGSQDITGQFGARRLAGLMTGVPARNLIGIDPSANALVGSVTGSQPEPTSSPRGSPTARAHASP